MEAVLMASLGPGRLGAELDREIELFGVADVLMTSRHRWQPQATN
jgi:hypothetical protein